jgi:ribonuclease P protein component
MIGRLVRSADFERVLAIPARWRSSHFVVHHLAQAPLPAYSAWLATPGCVAEIPPASHALAAQEAKLSTGAAPACPQPVDDSLQDQWIGCVVPKRHAKRAVTRSLFKRQIRGAFDRHAQTLPAGQWLVRLRAPFSVKVFVSAASEALRLAARDELDGLFVRCAAQRTY